MRKEKDLRRAAAVPSTGKARRMLCFEATTTLDQMLDEVIPWLTLALAAGAI